MNIENKFDLSGDLPKVYDAPAKITLSLSCQVTDDDNLQVKWKVENNSKRDIFVFDRLWKSVNDGKNIIADEEQTYRFVRENTLLLAACAAPTPESVMIFYRNVPYATKVLQGQDLTREFELPAPVREYNYYFPHTEKSEYEPVETSQIVMVLALIKAAPTIKTVAAPFDDEALAVNVPGVWDEFRFLKSPPVSLDVETRRRKDEFSRRLNAPVSDRN